MTIKTLKSYQICIVMAVYQPAKQHFYEQLNSIQKQSHENFICLCVFDGVHNQSVINELFLSDPRFHFIYEAERLGCFQNFERGLTYVPDTADYIALADQDDIWEPYNLTNKLELALSKNAELVFGDVRVVKDNKQLITDSLYHYRNNPTNLTYEELLMMNVIPGMSILFKKNLLKHILPFPKPFGKHIFYHDHWIALIASNIGATFAFLNRTTVDYRQHGNNTVGVGRHNYWFVYLISLIRCLFIYPFLPAQCITHYHKRRILHNAVMKRLKKPSNTYRVTVLTFIRLMQKKYYNHAILCWKVLIAQCYLRVGITKKYALNTYQKLFYYR